MARRARKTSTARFVALPHFMTGSPAWLSLSLAARCLLIDLWRRHNGQNNGEITYAIREAADAGIDKSSAGRAFRDLIDRGFLRVRGGGSFEQRTKHARSWEITAERCEGQPARLDFMRWKPPRDGPEN